MDDFTIDLDELRFLGRGLRRPECVLCTRAGAIFVSDWRGGVTRLGPDGRQQSFLGRDAPVDLRPNGIALQRDGGFLLANLGEAGGVYRLERDGRVHPFLLRVDGVDLPPSNFVLVDHRDRVWITVSTRRRPRALGYRPDVDDGFIVLADAKGARIVADGLGYTNEVQLDAGGDWLYVNETFGRRLSRFRVAADGALSARETVTRFGHGTYPDGLSFDAEGAAWITSIVSNRVIRVTPDGAQQVVLEDADADHLERVERAFLVGEMGRPHLDAVESRRLANISSLAFGGPDLRNVYLGCLLGDRIATFRAAVPGRPPAHWEVEG